MGRRLAVAGVTTALAAGALVGASTTSASADFSATGTYTCTVLGNNVPMPLTATVPLLPPAANAGTTIPANLLDVSTALTIPAAVASQLGTAGVTGGSISDFGMLVGDTLAPAPLSTVTFGAPGTDGSVLATSAAKNSQFTLPAAGVYDVTLPKSFTFVPSTAAGPLPITVPCTTDAPAKMSSITLAKSDVATAVSSYTKTVKKGKHGSVSVKVEGMPTLSPTGTVKAFEGTKKVGTGTLSNGVAKVKLGLLSVGKHKITVKYLGDGYYKAGQKTAVGTVKVIR